MISLACTSCKKQLEIDDAFAGGVCRCQHCGTIQTVPASLKRTPQPGGARAPVGAAIQKALWQQKRAGGAAPATPAEVSTAADTPTVADTPRAARAANPVAPPAEPPYRKPWIIALVIAAALLLIALIAYFAW